VNNKVETTDLSETELLLVDTSSVDLFPNPVMSNVCQYREWVKSEDETH